MVEELEPFVELHVKAIAGENNIPVKIHGKDLLPIMGELSSGIVAKAMADLTRIKPPADFEKLSKLEQKVASLLPWRPPTLCPGCPHRASFHNITMAARKVARGYGIDVQPVYPGDIGCYTLAYNPPLEAEDSCICMGGSFGIANGLAHVIKAPIIAHLGDSTFFHSGIPPLINAVYNKAKITMMILDNSATAMTGFQPHPGTGYTATGTETIKLKPEDIARACGVKFVEVVDPFDLKKSIETIQKAMEFDGPSVVVSRSLCAMIDQREKKKRKQEIIPYRVNKQKCNEKCSSCIKLLGCPAILKEGSETLIDAALCTGCSLCAQVCPYKAIVQE